ncbi:MAG: hypothetical protein ACRDKT_13485 [Actinomycetota bacterium]
MAGFSLFELIAPLSILFYIGTFIYILVLLTRLTRAVERIAEKLDQR